MERKDMQSSCSASISVTIMSLHGKISRPPTEEKKRDEKKGEKGGGEGSCYLSASPLLTSS